jgi:hypothetical protein
MVVARGGNVAAAELLLERGANVNAREARKGQTALMWAVAQSHPAMVRLLLEHGAEVEARSTVNEWERMVTAEPRQKNLMSGGFTPLLYAARQGCRECASLLLDAGAKVDLTDPDGVTPLLSALLNAHFDTAKYLLERGANPNKWDFWGRTPLYLAVDFNTLPHGGRPDRPSLDDTTGIEMIDILLAAGANPNAQLKLFPPYRSLRMDRGADTTLDIGTTRAAPTSRRSSGSRRRTRSSICRSATASRRSWQPWAPARARSIRAASSARRSKRSRRPRHCSRPAPASMCATGAAAPRSTMQRESGIRTWRSCSSSAAPISLPPTPTASRRSMRPTASCVAAVGVPARLSPRRPKL